MPIEQGHREADFGLKLAPKVTSTHHESCIMAKQSCEDCLTAWENEPGLHLFGKMEAWLCRSLCASILAGRDQAHLQGQDRSFRAVRDAQFLENIADVDLYRACTQT
jgi:hypothetical protein